jgi:hypothetical protein
MKTYAEPATERDGDEYEPVTGRDQETVACVRACEAEAAAKTASDYAHVVWAYGVIWSLFAIYGVLLWRRATRQRVEIADMMSRLDARSGEDR